MQGLAHGTEARYVLHPDGEIVGVVGRSFAISPSSWFIPTSLASTLLASTLLASTLLAITLLAITLLAITLLAITLLAITLLAITYADASFADDLVHRYSTGAHVFLAGC
ncbi:hypothetical protein B0T26DRAFT_756718 [Lasiosphaeria miniovina]|uniref:Uncharacterized protein n=1 Tax=Lasiosphaeria miniovina TaxID=1954250 RepID=A0AA39ZTA1_9PEZI|nr:uncharacterized protein B0T26DRAFT_756718 [Lasiosphaeria miniovina]KAK0703155.1 hypothetical protein B0T26DRAFT_756718 [Lasiosphaeria miniovina]